MPAYGSSVDFCVLGRLTVRRGADEVSLGGPKQRSVVAHLLAAPDRRLAAGELIQALYGDDAAPRSKRTLHTFVSNLRKELSDTLVRDGNGYRLTISDSRVDAARFEHEYRAAIATDDDAEAASSALRTALAGWRGHPYSDIEPSPFLTAEITRLQELRLTALQARIDADLELGRHRDLVGELQALTSEHPLRERFWAQHMLALYRSGRQAEALRAFARARTRLVEELGMSSRST